MGSGAKDHMGRYVIEDSHGRPSVIARVTLERRCETLVPRVFPTMGSVVCTWHNTQARGVQCRKKNGHCA